MFTDGMMVVIKPDGKFKVWRKSLEKWRPECLGHFAPTSSATIKIMVWGCITYYVVGSLAFINGNMNSQKYIQTLDDNSWQAVVNHFGNKTWYFQDDNAPCHRSNESENWKHQNRIPQISWPPQSPDLSPIENVWLLMKNKIKNRLYLIRNVTDLKTQLTKAWNEIPLFCIK